MTAAPVLLFITVDTEEDNWHRARQGVTAENIGELPFLAQQLAQRSLRATYFTTYQVAKRPWAVDLLRDICSGDRGEIGAHLHPWNTPPLSEALVPRHSMLKNLPADLQVAKLQRLTATLAEAFGTAPTAFRAGRFGIGADALGGLIACGYRVDSSVSPYLDWRVPDDGPSFVGAPIDAYRVGPRRGVMIPDVESPLVEIPLTSGYTGFSSSRWPSLHRLLHAPSSRALHLAGVACRLRVARLTILSPESESLRDMLSLTQGALDGGARYLNLLLHSPSLKPGLTPWSVTARDVVRLYARLDEYLDGLSKMTAWQCVTMTEARYALGFGAHEPVMAAS